MCHHLLISQMLHRLDEKKIPLSGPLVLDCRWGLTGGTGATGEDTNGCFRFPHGSLGPVLGVANTGIPFRSTLFVLYYSLALQPCLIETLVPSFMGRCEKFLQLVAYLRAWLILPPRSGIGSKLSANYLQALPVAMWEGQIWDGSALSVLGRS